MIAEDIIVKFLAGEAEPHEIAFLEKWRLQSEENQKQFMQIARLWEHSGKLSDEKSVDADAAWNKVSQRLGKSTGKVVTFGRTWMAVAASILLLLGIGTWLYIGNSGDAKMLSAVSNGEKLRLDLQDGSKITLMEGELSYPDKFEGNSRRVEMKSGRVYFDIARDTSRQFEIQCGKSTITVLGTEFEVTYTKELVRVLVSEGKVLFKTPAGETILTAGMKAEFDVLGNRHVTSSKENLNSLVYATGQLEYNEEMLSKILKDISLYDPNIKIEVDNGISNCKISGKFDMRDGIKDVLDVIALTMNATLRTSEDGTYRLEGGICQ